VISAYICCIKDQEHLQIRDDVKFYFENPFISEMLKRDGNLGLNGDGNCITKIVRSYLEYQMVTPMSLCVCTYIYKNIN
jgi:hypothetical protein